MNLILKPIIEYLVKAFLPSLLLRLKCLFSKKWLLWNIRFFLKNLIIGFILLIISGFIVYYGMKLLKADIIDFLLRLPLKKYSITFGEAFSLVYAMYTAAIVTIMYCFVSWYSAWQKRIIEIELNIANIVKSEMSDYYSGYESEAVSCQFVADILLENMALIAIIVNEQLIIIKISNSFKDFCIKHKLRLESVGRRVFDVLKIRNTSAKTAALHAVVKDCGEYTVLESVKTELGGKEFDFKFKICPVYSDNKKFVSVFFLDTVKEE